MSKQEFTVSDVYQHAAMIGQDIEVIVHDYGKEAIEEIMPKIVFVLEQLESLAEQRKLDEEMIDKLMIEKESLVIHTKRDEAIQRQLEEKLCYMETLISEDKEELKVRFKRLQQENDCLCEELDKKETELMKLRAHGALPGDVEVMMRMKATIDEQRDQIRQLRSELNSQRRDVEAVQDNTERLTNLNENLLRNNYILKSKLKHYQSKNSLTEVDGNTDTKVDKNYNSIADVSREIVECQLDEIDEQVEDDVSLQEGNISLQDELLRSNKDDVSEDSRSLTSVSTVNQSETSVSTVNQSETSRENTESMTGRPGTRSFKDPNRARYTLKEMQDVLEEKNRYKIEKLALEEELELYKQGGGMLIHHSSTDSQHDISRKKSSGVRSLMSKFMGK